MTAAALGLVPVAAAVGGARWSQAWAARPARKLKEIS